VAHFLLDNAGQLSDASFGGATLSAGTLWSVDDVATSASFIQLFRHLDQGLPKADALRATREAMAQWRLRLKGMPSWQPTARPCSPVSPPPSGGVWQAVWGILPSGPEWNSSARHGEARSGLFPCRRSPFSIPTLCLIPPPPRICS
jgi:hypothetical protein